MIHAFLNTLPLFAYKKLERFNTKTLVTTLRVFGWLYIAYFVILGATEVINRFGVFVPILVGLKVAGGIAVTAIVVIGGMFVKDEMDYRQRERNLDEAQQLHRAALEDTRRISARQIQKVQAQNRAAKEAEALLLGLHAEHFITHGDILERFAKADPDDSLAFFRTMDQFHKEV